MMTATPRGSASERAAKEARELSERLSRAAPAEITERVSADDFRRLREAARTEKNALPASEAAAAAKRQDYAAPADFVRVVCPACGKAQYTFERNLAAAVKRCVECGKPLRLASGE